MLLTEKGIRFFWGKSQRKGIILRLTFRKEKVKLLLYQKGGNTPRKVLPFPEDEKMGRVCAMEVKGISGEMYEYNYEIDGKICQDPFAYCIRGKKHFGERTEDENKVRCGFLPEEKILLGGRKAPEISYEDMVLYKLHVRGYTKLVPNMGRKKGTFAGLTEMIPYWKELGINTVELMPAYEFPEVPSVKQEGEKEYITDRKENDRVNYWGYASGYYLSPKRAYCTEEPCKMR